MTTTDVIARHLTQCGCGCVHDMLTANRGRGIPRVMQVGRENSQVQGPRSATAVLRPLLPLCSSVFAFQSPPNLRASHLGGCQRDHILLRCHSRTPMHTCVCLHVHRHYSIMLCSVTHNTPCSFPQEYAACAEMHACSWDTVTVGSPVRIPGVMPVPW